MLLREILPLLAVSLVPACISDLHARETHDPEALEASIQELVLKKKSAKSQLRDVTEQQQVIMNDVFDIYDSLLSESQRSDWTKIVEDLCHSNPYMTRRNKSKIGPRGQTKKAFHDCIHAHLLTVFSHDAAEQERHYLQCSLKKSPKVTIRQFISRMSQLNGYLSLLPCLYDSEYAINTTCRLDKPFTESELAQIVLDAQWLNAGVLRADQITRNLVCAQSRFENKGTTTNNPKIGSILTFLSIKEP